MSEDEVARLARWAMVGDLNNRHMDAVSDGEYLRRSDVLAALSGVPEGADPFDEWLRESASSLSGGSEGAASDLYGPETPEGRAADAIGDEVARRREVIRAAIHRVSCDRRASHDAAFGQCSVSADAVAMDLAALSGVPEGAARDGAPSSASPYLRDALEHWLAHSSSIEAADDLRTAAAEWLRDIEEDDRG